MENKRFEFSKEIYGDGVGKVTLLDYMGDEFVPAADARTSTGKGNVSPEKDAALERRLMIDRHTSPFEGVTVKFEITAPLFAVRELDRHRTVTKFDGRDLTMVSPEENVRKWFARNEMSGRYIQMPDLYYIPNKLRFQDKNLVRDTPAKAFEKSFHEEFVERGMKISRDARELYDWAIRNNIERGQARIFNTQNQYTIIRISGSLKNFMDLLSLRLEEGVVLEECRLIALAFKECLDKLFPTPMKIWYDDVYLPGLQMRNDQYKKKTDLTDEETYALIAYFNSMSVVSVAKDLGVESAIKKLKERMTVKK